MKALRSAMRWALLAGLVLLSACASPSRPSAHQAAFWSGRLGLQVQSQPPQNMAAAFELQGSASEGELVLLSPIGSTLAQLRWTPASAELHQGGRQWSGRSLDELTEQLSGTALPMTALFDWLAGQATAPAGWHVDLSGWPQGRIQAERQTPAPAVQLKLLVDR